MSYLIWFWFFCFFPRTPNITNTIHPYTTFSALITCIAIQVEDSPITYKSFIQNKRRQNYFTFHFHFFFFHYHFKSNIGESYLRSLLLSKINSLGMDWDWMDQNLAPFAPPPPPPPITFHYHQHHHHKYDVLNSVLKVHFWLNHRDFFFFLIALLEVNASFLNIKTIRTCSPVI